MIRRNIALDRNDPLPDPALRLDLVRTQRMALLAWPYVPHGSFYKKWIVELLDRDGMIEAWKYAKLRARLVRAQGEESN